MGRRGGKGDGEGGEDGLGEEVAARVWERGGTEGAERGCSFGGSCVFSCAGCLGTLGGSCVSPQETEVGGGKRRGGWGGERQVEEQSGEAKVRVPCCQSMRGLCRANQGNRRTSWK